MPKTTFSDTPPLGTIVTAAFLNAVNNHRHTGEAIDGAGAINYALDTGAANAYAISLSPPLTGHITGMLIAFKAVNANTGPSTLNINGLGAVAIKKIGTQALVAGDIAAGQIIVVAYDGTYYQIVGHAYDAPQTWQNVKLSRSLGVTYYNTTSRPICVYYAGTNVNKGTSINFVVDGTIIGYASENAVDGGWSYGMFIVPPGSSYAVTAATGIPTMTSWFELR